MDSNIFWTEQDKDDLSRAKNFNELFQIAILVLQRLKITVEPKKVSCSARKRKVIMVCGPITSGGLGSVRDNLKVFGKYIRRMSSRGYAVFSQLRFEGAMWRIRTEMKCSEEDRNKMLLEIFYGQLFRSGYIDEFFFIPGWETSFGASWEHEFIKKLGKPIYYL